jgi:hypothetical protein
MLFAAELMPLSLLLLLHFGGGNPSVTLAPIYCLSSSIAYGLQHSLYVTAYSKSGSTLTALRL